MSAWGHGAAGEMIVLLVELVQVPQNRDEQGHHAPSEPVDMVSNGRVFPKEELTEHPTRQEPASAFLRTETRKTTAH